MPPQSFQETLLTVADEHPVMVHYLKAPIDPSPLRMSDLISQRAFERTRTYPEIFQPLEARFQFAILTGRDDFPDGRAWAFNRGLSDFTEDDVETARRLRPSLVVLDDMFRTPPAEPEPAVVDESLFPNTVQAGLPTMTPRELEVIGLLSQGWTARHIAHALRLSSRTVQKHLEHIYEKMGVHDRMIAVDRARRAGLIPPRPGPAP